MSRSDDERIGDILDATNALADETTDRYPDVPWSDGTRLRIALAHHYHRVGADQVWVIATDFVPAMARSLEAGSQ